MADCCIHKAAQDTDVFFDILEKTPDYKEIEKITAKALEDQWQDLVLSGVINTLFSKYKEFFISRKGKKIKIKKAVKTQLDKLEENEEIRSIADLKDQEKRTLQGNRIITTENVLRMAPLLLFLRGAVDSNSKSVGSYYNLRADMRGYLKKTGNRGGQTIINQITSPKPLTFRLSKKDYINKINERVSTLIKGLDATTKKRMVSELAKGIKLGETKAQMTKRLTSAGSKIAKMRAKRIVATETEAVAEWTRYETAKMNGVKVKTWETVPDERVCPTCAPLDSVKKPMGANFSSLDFEGRYPPAHPLCRCTVHYDVINDRYLEYIKKSSNTLSDKVKDVVEKARQYKFYTEKDLPKDHFTITNPNAVWAGGENLVGPDKQVGNIYYDITQQLNYEEKATYPLSIESGVLKLDEPGFLPANEVEALLLKARQNLSDVGFIQIALKLGFYKKFPAKT